MARIKIGKDRKNLIKSHEYGIWDNSAVGDFHWEDYWGFVYEIKNLGSGRCYIGSKVFRFKIPVKKDGTNTRMSDWKKYTSSSVAVNKELDNRVDFSFKILSLHLSKTDMMTSEAELQSKLNVLKEKDAAGNRLFYNGNIQGESFVNVNTEPFTESRKRKIGANRDYSKGLQGTPLQIESYELNKTKSWWNDGTKSFFLLPEEDTEGLVKGRLITEEQVKVCPYCKDSFKTNCPHKVYCTSWCHTRYVCFKEEVEKYIKECKEGLNYPKVKIKYKPLSYLPSYKTISLEGFREEPCKWCGSGIPIDSRRHVHCSSYCKDKYKKYLSAERTRNPLKILNCTVCGKEISTRVKAQHLCSPSCRNKHKNRHRKLKEHLRTLTREEIVDKLLKEFNIKESTTTEKGELVRVYVQAFVDLVEIKEKET